MKNNEEEWYVFKKTYSDEIFFRTNTTWPLKTFRENGLNVEELLEGGYIEALPSKKVTTKNKSEFLKDQRNTIKLESIPTAEFAFEEIAGDPNKKIIYYENGVLTTKDGLGNIARYKNAELYFRTEILKEDLKQVIIKSDAPFELQERLINGIKEIIDDYVEEKEEDDETGQ
ncbi:hypothetical protein [Cytobacillus kochii]|uniref:hypothetical protein n=1 Tax=Cytobacillus kochii TaxID=859143 RepID=UPI00203FEEC4|nr:hypothetical protein [Cytobacillus kochii]MCM3323289.1 hypothetical protein [Cytobacillus kochii]MCM3345684.1 hypothetical protein [Cytobacillus kochii]